MDLVHVSVGSSTITNVPLWWRILIMWKPCMCKDREYVKTFVLSTQFYCKPKTAFSSVQSVSRVRLFATPWTAARPASLSIAKSRSLLRLMSIESVMPFNHLILCQPLLLPPSIFPSIRSPTADDKCRPIFSASFMLVRNLLQ